MNKTFLYLLILTFSLSCKLENQETTIVQNKPEKVIRLDSLLHPWSIAFLNEQEVLITEKDGHLIKANLQTKQKTIIKGFSDDLVDSIRVKDFRDNSGVFEVLLHPDFAENNWIYISYAAENVEGTTTKIGSSQTRIQCTY